MDMRETSMCWRWFPHSHVDGNCEAGLTVPFMELDTYNVGVFDIREIKWVVYPQKLP